MIIDLIGGSGFIGTRLTKIILEQGDADVRIVDKLPSSAYPNLVSIADVRDINALRKAIRSNAIVINLAAEHRDDVEPRSLYDEVNTQGAQNICDVCEEKGVSHIIFTSSVAIYGFAAPYTDETGAINPFNDYGRTKHEAENVFLQWHSKAPLNRTLTTIRPTVVFGETNRGNLYNLMRQIASGKFVMIGQGKNRKSMAYVGNIAAFILHALSFPPRYQVFNYADKPDFEMNELIGLTRQFLGKPSQPKLRLPYFLGVVVGLLFDVAAKVTRRKFPISRVRIKKFCANSTYNSSVSSTGFVAPIPIDEALKRTIQFEFLGADKDATLAGNPEICLPSLKQEIQRGSK